MRWLKFYGYDAVRINESDVVIVNELTSSKLIFTCKGQTYNLEDFKSFWYRRGFFPVANQWGTYVLENKEERIQNLISEHIKSEAGIVKRFLDYFVLNNLKCLDTYTSTDENKLMVLDLAAKLGFLVPEWVVTSDRFILKTFRKKYNGKIVAKSLGSPFSYYSDKIGIATFTSSVLKKEIDNLNDFFPLTFAQARVSKAYEIRTFVLKSKIWSMAMLTQASSKTRVDFRHYVKHKPNRCLPVKLPQELEIKIVELMLELNLTSGSIDFIKDLEGNYNFLEINPIGQFGMTSKPCNYHLEREVAQYLIN
jgi:ATP-GRASP peptide maturase of grasp-with-spasm system